uniref:Leucine rich repeat containing 43 n=1 Tax=Labrus bergylta TaxID=56723 RepID=A0A3Q3ESP4_9LABR
MLCFSSMLQKKKQGLLLTSMSSNTLSAVLKKLIQRLCLEDFPCGYGSWVSCCQATNSKGAETEETDALLDMLSCSHSPWRVDASWSPQASALRRIAVLTPERLSTDFVYRYFSTLRVVDKEVSVIDDGLLRFSKLEELVLSANRISQIPAENLPSTLKGNPFTLASCYPGLTVDSLPQLSCLDAVWISSEERRRHRGLTDVRGGTAEESRVVGRMRGIPDPMMGVDENAPEFPVITCRYHISYDSFSQQAPVTPVTSKIRIGTTLMLSDIIKQFFMSFLQTPNKAGSNKDKSKDKKKKSAQDLIHDAPVTRFLASVHVPLLNLLKTGQTIDVLCEFGVLHTESESGAALTYKKASLHAEQVFTGGWWSSGWCASLSPTCGYFPACHSLISNTVLSLK